jgi:Ser/Thr protein kinase RdoA (MazF antagonist)
MVGRKPDKEALRALLGTKLGEILKIVPLDSGTTGTSYRIDTSQSQYVAKLFSGGADNLLGPEAQFGLFESLSRAGIAPRPVLCEPLAGLLVTEFMGDAAAVDAAEFRAPQRITEVAKLIRSLHQIDADIPAFAPAEYSRRYIERLGGKAALSDPNRRLYDELLELAAGLGGKPDCLCHNDLTADNILFGPSPVLIDFDYAVLAAPIVDLASVVVMNDFDSDNQSLLLSEYYRGHQVPFSAAEFARVQRLVRLLSHFWSLASTDAEAAIVAQYRIEDV